MKKKKKSKDKGPRNISEIQGKMQENSIFSKLETLDKIRKEEGSIVEEKLKSGLLKSEQTAKEEKIENEKLTLIEIQKEIDQLQEIKKKYHAEKDYEKAIKISKKIIVKAFSQNLKSVVNEENEYIDITRKNLIQESEELELKNEMESTGALEAVSIERVIVNKAIGVKESGIQEIDQLEDEKQNIKTAKLEFEQEKHKFEEENLKLKEERNKFEQEKLEFEERKERFRQQNMRFEEEKEAFKWEKKMLDELKKHERERSNNSKKS
jgi:hypothetical protein